MKDKTLLSDFSHTTATELPTASCHCRVSQQRVIKEEHFTFSAGNLPEVPPRLAAPNLVVTKTKHQYGNCVDVDTLHFYASGGTHRDLGVLILAVIFSGKPQRVAIELEHEASSIKELEINFAGFSRGACWGYSKTPRQFVYHPEVPNRIPWDGHFDEKDLPLFELDFSKGSGHHPINDLDKRDRVEIRGGDDGLVLVADLLLNLGLPECDEKPCEGPLPADKTYVLECFLGHQRVNKWSAEAQFHLPKSFSWPGEYPELIG